MVDNIARLRNDDARAPFHKDAREARAAYITEISGELYLTLGAGDHSCDRWLISTDQLRTLVSDGFKIVMKGR